VLELQLGGRFIAVAQLYKRPYVAQLAGLLSLHLLPSTLQFKFFFAQTCEPIVISPKSAMQVLPPPNELELGTEELLMTAVLEELGAMDELDGTTELLLVAILEEEDGSPVFTLDDGRTQEEFPM
jgi:hypothetical protein